MFVGCDLCTSTAAGATCNQVKGRNCTDYGRDINAGYTVVPFAAEINGD